MYYLVTQYYTNYSTIEKTVQNSIALLGQPGIGKTHLLIALCHKLMQNDEKSVLYFPFVEGFDNLRSSFDKLEEKLTKMKKADILFIDDLFKPVSKQRSNGERMKIPQASEWEIKQVYAVVNSRYLNNKPIFISSELFLNEIIYLDEALGSRIYDMCKDYYIEILDNVNLNYRLK